MRILICDDDILFTEQLKKHICDYFHKMKVKNPDIVIYENGEDLLADTGTKDIVFLDIEMPGLSGIYVGRELKKSDKHIIIFVITSYMEYLDDAMQFEVFRYLCKPLDRQRLFRNLKDALETHYYSAAKLSIATKERHYIVKASDIIFVEAIGREVIVHTLKGDYKSKDKMKHWVASLDMNCFFHTHRSFIINMKYVSGYNNSIIYLCNDEYIAYLTKNKYTKFNQAYLLYSESTR